MMRPGKFRAGLALAMLISMACASGQDMAEGEVLVVFRPGRSADVARRVLARHALDFSKPYQHISRGRGQRVTGLVREKSLKTSQIIDCLKHEPDLECVEPNHRIRRFAALPDDPGFSSLWGLRNVGQSVNGRSGTPGVDIRGIDAWALARRGAVAEVVVAVLDFGFDPGHPDLAANLWKHPGEVAGNGIDDDGNGYVDDVHGYDFGIGTAALSDPDEHGTHVAGTIGAVGNNQYGVIGVAPRAKLLLLKGSDAAGEMYTATTIEAFDYAIALKQRGVNLVAINASYGSSAASTSERLAIEALRDHGIALCAAAGNDATNNDAVPTYPACYDTANVISVAAHTQTGALASFSNFGATSVDLAAPGQSIFSTRPLGSIPVQSRVSHGAASYTAQSLQSAGMTPPGGIAGAVYHCSLGYPGDFPAAVAGNIALIQRGELFFSQKVANAMSAGAVAAILYDNTADPITTGSWTLGSGSWIPAVRVTRANGQAMLANLALPATVTNVRDQAQAFQFLDGTSMAAPHVTAALAFAAQQFPAETMAQRIQRVLGAVTPVAAFNGLMTRAGRLNLLQVVDSDGDGLPDWWELEQFASLGRTATGDEDGDGDPNGLEYRAATNPRDAGSRFGFSSVEMVAEGGLHHMECAFPAAEERRYQLEWSPSLMSGSWLPLGDPVIGTGATLRLRDPLPPTAPGRRFYRLALLPD